jgi:hypothetical protein
MRAVLSVLLLALGTAAASAAVPIRIEVDVAGRPPAEPLSATLVAEPGDGSLPTVRADIPIPGEATVDLPAGLAVRQVRLEAPGFWVPPQTLAPGQPRLRFRLLPAGTLKGRIAVPSNQAGP